MESVSKTYMILVKNEFGAWEDKSNAFISNELSDKSKIIYFIDIILIGI